MTASALQKRGIAKTAGTESAFLDQDFRPDDGTLVSFLLNALSLIGDHDILAYGGLGGEAGTALSRLGHRIDAVPADWGSGPAPGGRRGAGGPGLRRRGKGHDRAVALTEAFGRGGDGELLEKLRAMGKALRPGGLLTFHVLDRDRAWGLTGERRNAGDGRRGRVGFDPATGRVSARLLEPETASGTVRPGRGASASVKAFNLTEIREWLRAAGLVLERAYGGWNGGSPETEGAATGRLIVVAAKPRRSGSARGRRWPP